MLKTKSVWLPLALPLLLIGCGDNTSNIIPESTNSSTSQSLQTNQAPATTPAEPEPEPDIQLEIREDQVEQVDTINETLDDFPVLEIEAAQEAEANAEVQTNAAVSDPQASNALNGEYSYEVSYATPPGTTEMTVVFGLTNNTINQVRLEGNPQHSTSLQYQKKIEDELGNLIVGKELSNVEPLPSRSAGSSLTPTAFNDALAQLQAEA